MILKILAVGDLIGSAGINELRRQLKRIKEKEKIDFIIVNGENSAEGMGITEKNFNDILSQNVDVITMGNHTWGKKDIFKFIDRSCRRSIISIGGIESGKSNNRKTV